MVETTPFDVVGPADEVRSHRHESGSHQKFSVPPLSVSPGLSSRWRTPSKSERWRLFVEVSGRDWGKRIVVQRV